MEGLSNKGCPEIVACGIRFFLQLIPFICSTNLLYYPLEFDKLLSQFTQVFKFPTTLHPQRPYDHHIPILPSSNSINLRPFLYPHYQKFEIKKMIRELLYSGLIRPSNFHLFYPVLLIKMAKDNWRFCVDYKALNVVTMKDKYQYW